MGGVRLQIHDAGEGEASCMMMLNAPEQNVLFCADVVQHEMTAFLLEGHSAAWLRQLDSVMSKYENVLTVYPGHGQSGSAAKLFGFQKQYISAFRESLQKNSENGALTDAEKMDVLNDMRRMYPDYLPVATIPDLLEKDVDALQQEMFSPAK